MIMLGLVLLYLFFVREREKEKAYSIIVYFIIYVTDLISILISSYKLLKILKNKRNEAYEEHKILITFFALLICFSIIMRLSTVQGILSYDWNAIVKYSIVELAILLIFSIFKKDEDCFACFNRSNEEEIYSIF